MKKKLLYTMAMIVGMYGVSEGMDLEQSFDATTKSTGIPWQDIIEKTQETAKHPKPHTIDVESAYGGGETYDARIVCEQALEGDSVAQYSLYRHIKHEPFVAYMLLAISAIFGKFRDSIDEAASLGLGLKVSETPQTLQQKIANITGQHE